MTMLPIMHLLSLFLFLSLSVFVSAFDSSDLDSYGVRIAGNDWIAAQAVNSDPSVGLSYIKVWTSYTQYPYNQPEYFCALYADESAYWEGYSMFVYGIHIGSRDSVAQSLLWWGENTGGSYYDMVNSGVQQMTVSVFQGAVVDPRSLTDPNYEYTCDYSGATQVNDATFGVMLVAVRVWERHEEFFQMAVKPEGDYAVAIANSFAFIMPLTGLSGFIPPAFVYLWNVSTSSPLYNPQNLSSNYPIDVTFGPRAVALETNWGVVAGWAQNSGTKLFSPIVYLFAHTSSSISFLDRWMYVPLAGSWQQGIQITDATTWLPKHDISVAVRSDGMILVGIQLYNSVFLFQRSTNHTLILIGSKVAQPKQIGFGKTVSWTNNQRGQILANTYSADYLTSLADSQIQVYDIPAYSVNSTWSTASTALWDYPNPDQQLSIYLYSTFIYTLSTPSNLYIMDTAGVTLFIQPAAPGYYQPTLTGYDAQVACPAGTYNNETSYLNCQLCPAGTMNNGSRLATVCTQCPATAYCPLGAVAASDVSTLISVSQGFVYPSNPQSTIFDDIIIANVFFIHGPSHCLAVSPIFWGLIIFGVLVVIFVCMMRLRYCVNDAKSKKIRRLTKFLFKRTDLVQEGEHWIGGLMSIVLIVLVIMGIWFTSEFVTQYPYETAINPGFACEPTYNAQFSSSLQPVALPPNDDVAPVYDMLTNQQLELTLDIINTQMGCADVSIAWVRAINTPLFPLTCVTGNGTISTTLSLPSHDSTVQLTLGASHLIGGLRVTLTGAAATSSGPDEYQLLAMSASQAYYQSTGTLQKAVDMSITLTKVINQTEPLISGGQSVISGLWVPVYPAADSDFFMSAADFQLSGNTPFVITIDTSESTYWMYNEQEPIARSAEAAFKALLYIIMLLEVFGLAFLIFKLGKPIAHCVALKLKRRSVKHVWDQPDSSDEEDWLDDLMNENQLRMYQQEQAALDAMGINIKRTAPPVPYHHAHHQQHMGVQQHHGLFNPFGTTTTDTGMRELTDEERAERALARQQRRERLAEEREKEEGGQGKTPRSWRHSHGHDGDEHGTLKVSPPGRSPRSPSAAHQSSAPVQPAQISPAHSLPEHNPDQTAVEMTNL